MKASSKRVAAGHALRAALLALPALLLAACGSAPSRPEPPARSSAPTTPAATPKPAAPAPDKGDVQARFDAALEVLKSGDLQQAEQQFGELTKDFPDYAGPWTNLGIVYAKTKRRDAAITALTRAATLNPQNHVAFNWLGMLNREAGNYDRARLAYEKALQIDPDDQLARLNYAILLDQYLKQPQAALAQYQAYQQHQAQAGKEDLRVLAWSAELEAKTQAAAPAPAAKPEKKP